MGSGTVYSPEFKAEAVRMVTELSRPVVDVAAQVGVSKDTLRVWVGRAKRMAQSDESDKSDSEVRELKALQRRIADLEMENSFLKKAAAFFAAEQKPKNGLR